MVILIPAYEPDAKLLKLIKAIRKSCSYDIVVVDDGSGSSYSSIFKAVKEWGCTVLTHKINQGKGSALKTGFRYIKEIKEQEGVVCADSDGQHMPQDIIKVALKVKEFKGHIILGCRYFKGNIPLRSRLGNIVTRMVFSFFTGNWIYDTQTGLRGYSSDMLDWLCQIPGERFEYEINVLLEANKENYSFFEVAIDTIYYKNHSSHFRTITDSAKVYLPILKFSTSSILSGLLDFSLLILLQALYSNLLLSVIGARIISSIFNYTVNKLFVFLNTSRLNSQNSAIKYFILVFVIMGFNFTLMYFFNVLFNVPVFYAKVLTETLLFIISYWTQDKFVFQTNK